MSVPHAQKQREGVQYLFSGYISAFSVQRLACYSNFFFSFLLCMDMREMGSVCGRELVSWRISFSSLYNSVTKSLLACWLEIHRIHRTELFFLVLQHLGTWLHSPWSAIYLWSTLTGAAPLCWTGAWRSTRWRRAGGASTAASTLSSTCQGHLTKVSFLQFPRWESLLSKINSIVCWT